MFKVAQDLLGNSFFTYDTNSSSFPVPTFPTVATDAAYFSQPNLLVSKRATTSLSSDLSLIDDLPIAFVALLLLSVIDGFVAVALLRTRDDQASNFSFSTKLFIEFAKDFRFRHLVTSNGGGTQQKRNWRLTAIAASLLIFTFALQVALLVLTGPNPAEVKNTNVSFRFQIPVLPQWSLLRFQLKSALDRPCEALSLVGVRQGKTEINPCVTSNALGGKLRRYKASTTEISGKIVSDIHEFGAEHDVTWGFDSVKLSCRTTFSLRDNKLRLMAATPFSAEEGDRIRMIHLQFLAFLFSSQHESLETELNESLAHLNNVESQFSSGAGLVSVLRGAVNATSRTYNTTFKGLLPQGNMTLRFAQQYFRSSSAVSIFSPNTKDLFVEEGVSESRVSGMWLEESRTINWLFLLLLFISALFALSILRLILQPISIVGVSSIWQKKSANQYVFYLPSDPGREESSEDRGQEISGDASTVSPKRAVPDDTPYRYGAEVGNSWEGQDLEYAVGRDRLF